MLLSKSIDVLLTTSDNTFSNSLITGNGQIKINVAKNTASDTLLDSNLNFQSSFHIANSTFSTSKFDFFFLCFTFVFSQTMIIFI